MEKVFVVVLVITIMVCICDIVMICDSNTSNKNSDVAWYDEEINLGWNERDGFYTVWATADDYTVEERAEMHLSDDWTFRVINLCDETVEAIMNGELDV